jgi:hypothetical protein
MLRVHSENVVLLLTVTRRSCILDINIKLRLVNIVEIDSFRDKRFDPNNIIDRQGSIVRERDKVYRLVRFSTLDFKFSKVVGKCFRVQQKV